MEGGYKMGKKISKYILLTIILCVIIFRPYMYRPSISIYFNNNSREELFADTGVIAPLIVQKFRNSPDIKFTPKLDDKLIIKHLILLSLLILRCYYIDSYQIDLRQRITRLIATYFNGSKYKDAFLFVVFQ